MERLLDILRALPSRFGYVPGPARWLIATGIAIEVLLFILQPHLLS